MKTHGDSQNTRLRQKFTRGLACGGSFASYAVSGIDPKVASVPMHGGENNQREIEACSVHPSRDKGRDERK